MTKQELSELLHQVCGAVNEGISEERAMTEETRIVYYVITEQDKVASGEKYHNIATYQIDIWSNRPQCDVYKELRKKLREIGIHPLFLHEFVADDPIYSRKWHTYFGMDVTDDE